jgi:hypothetical protein
MTAAHFLYAVVTVGLVTMIYVCIQAHLDSEWDR